MTKCKICNKEFEKPQSLGPHYQIEHGKKRFDNNVIRKRNEEEYEKNPIYCKQCNNKLSYEDKQRKKVFCTKECLELSNSERIMTNKKINNCKNCGLEIYNKKFCNPKCFNEDRMKKMRNEWLSTKILPNFSKKTGSGAVRGKYVREYIIEQQNYKCAICGTEQIWNSVPIVFILDHINGNYKDNSRENLRLICPNCDSQTITFKGRNKGNGREKRRI